VLAQIGAPRYSCALAAAAPGQGEAAAGVHCIIDSREVLPNHDAMEQHPKAHRVPGVQEQQDRDYAALQPWLVLYAPQLPLQREGHPQLCHQEVLQRLLYAAGDCRTATATSTRPPRSSSPRRRRHRRSHHHGGREEEAGSEDEEAEGEGGGKAGLEERSGSKEPEPDPDCTGCRNPAGFARTCCHRHGRVCACRVGRHQERQVDHPRRPLETDSAPKRDLVGDSDQQPSVGVGAGSNRGQKSRDRLHQGARRPRSQRSQNCRRASQHTRR